MDKAWQSLCEGAVRERSVGDFIWVPTTTTISTSSSTTADPEIRA